MWGRKVPCWIAGFGVWGGDPPPAWLDGALQGSPDTFLATFFSDSSLYVLFERLLCPKLRGFNPHALTLAIYTR